MAQGKIRTLRFSAGKLRGVELNDSHMLLTWAAEFAGLIMSRAHKHTSDGKTAFELRNGKMFRRKLPAWSEKVNAIVVGKRKLKQEYRCFDALFVALEERTGMLVVATPEGCYRVAAVTRLPKSQRGDADLVKKVCGFLGVRDRGT